LRLKIESDSFTLAVEDNGRGLTAASGAPGPAQNGDRLAGGSGMENLRKRLAAVGGDCEVRSEPGQGTRVVMTVRVKTGVSPILAMGVPARTG